MAVIGNNKPAGGADEVIDKQRCMAWIRAQLIREWKISNQYFVADINEYTIHAHKAKGGSRPALVNINQDIADCKTDKPTASRNKNKRCTPQVLIHWNNTVILAKSAEHSSE